METQKFVCKDFMFNNCKREKCKFNHIENICFHFWKNGICKFGTECSKSHEFRYNKGNKENNEKEEIEENTKNYKNTKNTKNKDKYNKKKIKNTECFVPMDKDMVDLRIVCDTNKDTCSTLLTSRDLILAPNVFSDYRTGEIYERLLNEIHNCGIEEKDLFKMWHGNNKIDGTHLIVDDHLHWKDKCPTFKFVLDRIVDFFNMDIQSTRFNYYKDSSQWKPFHHDAAAINPQKAKKQNFTVAVSFGATRDAALEHAKTKTVVSSPQPDGCIYAFSNDTNIIWRHGILKDSVTRGTLPSNDAIGKGIGRISIIAWGKSDFLKKID